MTLGSREEISRLRFCFRDLVAESIREPYTMGRDPWTFIAGDEAHQKRIDAALAELMPTSRWLYAAVRTVPRGDRARQGEPPVTLQDARNSLELVTAAYHSTRTGPPAALPIGADHPLYRSWLPDAAGR